jgi:hypothetical protein
MLVGQNKIFKKAPLHLLIVYALVFVYCLSNDAIYSYDTYDYLKAMPYRQLGYVIFVKSFSYIFGSYFDTAVVLFQTVFSLFAVHYFYTKASKLFALNTLLKLLLLAILIFPFFQPLSIVNNICSEGFSYGLYLLFVAVAVDILFNNKLNYLKYYVLLYVALVFMRGQFVFSTLVFGFTYLIIHRKQISNKKQLITLFVFMAIPLIPSLGERTYHQFKDGIFKSTPFGYVSASTAAFYVSDKSDISLIKAKDAKAIFKLCHQQLEAKNLLLDSKDSNKESYSFFHEHLPEICNQTIHASGKAYFQSQDIPDPANPNPAVARAYFKIEAACKDLTFILIKVNFSKWLALYYANLSYGFYTPFFLFIIIFIMIFNFIKTLFSYQKYYAILFLFSSLILSNAMLIAFASHSIMRYLFYNYALFFLSIVGITKLIRRGSKS